MYYNSFKLFFSVSLFLSLLACSENESPTDEPTTDPELEVANVQSYSQDFGYNGDVVEITGSNFVENSSDVEVLFDGVASEIVSTSKTSIQVKLPLVENGIPKLEINMKDRKVVSEVANAYEGNIGVLAKVPGEWALTKLEGALPNATIWTSQLVSPDRLYYGLISGSNNNTRTTWRSLDGGLTFKRWAYQGFSNVFQATSTDEGWAESLRLLKIPAGGSVNEKEEILFTTTDKSNSNIAAISVSDDLKTGMLITGSKTVYKTTDGENFDVIYDPDYEYLTIRTGFRLDDEHFWAGGGNTTYGLKPSLLFTHDGGATWNDLELTFDEDGKTTVGKIQFVDSKNGFMLTYYDIYSPFRLRKTTDGGFTWNTVETLLPNTNFVFLDTKTGWSFSGNTIYKTTDGGLTWNEDLKAESRVDRIDIKDNVVVAKIENGILRYFL
ncbi:IPT/TIG domain-containing protein [Zobellia galactanivorans]|uniref:IPT/TIG domain-containing protein n=1 Tax=Zobellia galactanivorans (strain DSM 12802 / CCUG 47099 / CIP 106680 / NCIMB 13871 / Dsij) TaxID=63186 RepID=UPI001C079845|nr:IPT/TIG domain-containing protein [Zobellia galactanivorans]MBU3024864.1 IPT/TIG domain-containing protein [Zobellia galactanivorans]